MNEVKRTTFVDRLRNAVKAFKGQPIGSLYFGVDLKRCDECTYKKDRPLRDDLLVTAGARAAYMEDQGCIELPSGVDGEAKLATFVSNTVNHYLYQECWDVNYDEYIETALMKEYGPKKEN